MQKIVKRAGHNKGAGWNILVNLISEQADFPTKKPFIMHYIGRKPLFLKEICLILISITKTV